MKRILITGAIAAALALSGCGGEKDRPTGDEPTEPTTAEPTEPAVGDDPSATEPSQSAAGDEPSATEPTDRPTGDLPSPEPSGEETPTPATTTGTAQPDLVERWLSNPCPDAATVSAITGHDHPGPQAAPDFTEVASGCLYGSPDALEQMDTVSDETVVFVGGYEDAGFLDPAKFLSDSLYSEPESVTMLEQYPEGSFVRVAPEMEDGQNGCVAVILEDGTGRHALGVVANVENPCEAVLRVMETP